MREPTLKETAAFSLLLHFFLIGLTLLTFKKSLNFNLPAPYTVQLVSPRDLALSRKGKSPVASVQRIKEIKRRQHRKMMNKQKVTPPENRLRTDKGISVEDRIAAIRAKKRVEKIVRLRKAVLSIRPGIEQRKGDSKAKAVPPGVRQGSSVLSGYHALIKQRIWSEWVYPDFRDKGDLEVDVNIKIYKDGRVQILNVERASGNMLFDRSAERAIEKASPLPPPPYELEIVLRFTP